MQEPDRQALDRSQGKELTGISNREAERSALKLENAGQTLEKNFLSPTADTRNTIIATSLLTVVTPRKGGALSMRSNRRAGADATNRVASPWNPREIGPGRITERRQVDLLQN